MTVKIFKTEQEIGKCCAALFAAAVTKNPDCILGLATGSTPIPTYKCMIEDYKNGLTDYKNVVSYNLDEYVGLDANHDQSYQYFMNENLFSGININLKNTHFLSGKASDIEAECVGYDKTIEAAGGIDLQILGIGNNGHIAFNEPDTCFTKGTHKVTLTESTIEANKRFFASYDEVPRYALTMGIGTIMKAKTIVLVANGKAKAEAIKALVNGPISPSCPASILQLHNDVTLLIDEAAASLL